MTQSKQAQVQLCAAVKEPGWWWGGVLCRCDFAVYEANTKTSLVRSPAQATFISNNCRLLHNDASPAGPQTNRVTSWTCRRASLPSAAMVAGQQEALVKVHFIRARMGVFFFPLLNKNWHLPSLQCSRNVTIMAKIKPFNALLAVLQWKK